MVPTGSAGQVRAQQTRVSVSHLGPTLFADGTAGITSLRILNSEAEPVAADVAGETITVGSGEIVERADMVGTVIVEADERLFVTSRSSDATVLDALDARHDVQYPARDVRLPRSGQPVVVQETCSPTLVLSTASLACKFGTSTAAVVALPGATYAWTAQNASITSGLGTNTVTLAFGAASNASVSVSVTANGCVSAGAASIALRDPFQIGSFLPDTPSPRLGDRITLRWSYTTADAPRTQTLTITAPTGTPSVVKLPLNDRSYSFVVDRVGAWRATLDASLIGGRRRAVRSGTSSVPPPSSCATDARTATFVVGEACDNPEATVSGGGQACVGDRVEIRANFTGTPPFSGQWSDGAPFSTDASFITRTVAASGSYTLASFSDAICSGSSNGHATVTLKPAPTITTFTVPTSVGPGQSGTITFTYTNGTSYSFTSSLGNTFTPSGGNSTTGGSVIYSRDVAPGQDTVTFTVTGPCGTASSSRVIGDPAPVITSFTADQTRFGFGASTPLHFTIQNGASWTLSSSIGNGFNQSSGTGSGTFTVTYSAGNNTGADTVTLRVSGPGGTAQATVTITVTDEVPPGAQNFTISQNPVPAGGTATINFTIADTTTWTIVSSLSNSITPGSGSGSGSFSVQYAADTATGSDTVTLTLTGPGGVTTFTIHPVVN